MNDVSALILAAGGVDPIFGFKKYLAQFPHDLLKDTNETCLDKIIRATQNSNSLEEIAVAGAPECDMPKGIKRTIGGNTFSDTLLSGIPHISGDYALIILSDIPFIKGRDIDAIVDAFHNAGKPDVFFPFVPQECIDPFKPEYSRKTWPTLGKEGNVFIFSKRFIEERKDILQLFFDRRDYTNEMSKNLALIVKNGNIGALSTLVRFALDYKLQTKLFSKGLVHEDFSRAGGEIFGMPLVAEKMYRPSLFLEFDSHPGMKNEYKLLRDNYERFSSLIPKVESGTYSQEYALSVTRLSNARRWLISNRWTFGGYFMPGSIGVAHGLHNLFSGNTAEALISGGIETYLGVSLMAIAIQYRTRHAKRYEDIRSALLASDKQIMTREELLTFAEKYMVAPPCVRSTMRCVLESFFENGKELWYDVLKSRYKPIPAYVKAGINSLKG